MAKKAKTRSRSKTTPARAIRRAREAAGLSQADLARESGIPQESISRFEAGVRQPTVEVLERLADALEVSVDELLGRRTLDAIALARQRALRQLQDLLAE